MSEARMHCNENPLGPNPAVVAAIVQAAGRVHQYGTETELEAQITDKFGLEPGMVLLGNGSIELLEAVARRFLGPGKRAVTPQVSFMAYSLITSLNGAELHRAPVDEKFQVVDGLLRAASGAPDVIWLPNPNNPTGMHLGRRELDRVLQAVPDRTITVLDEAYIEFVEDDRNASVELLQSKDRLLVSRTFSKAHGIAGLRIGYLLGKPHMIEELRRIRLPMSVSALAIEAAKAALADDDFVDKTRAFVAQQRSFMATALSRIGVEVLAGDANFVTFRAPQAVAAQQLLARAGILVRELSEFGMPGFLRVSVGSAADNQTFIHAINTVLRKE